MVRFRWILLLTAGLILLAGLSATAPATATPRSVPTTTWIQEHPWLPPRPAPDASVPECPDHDPATFHWLYDPDRGCHYAHEHHDDPHWVDDIFGPPGAWWGGNQSISYPWQTGGGTENIHKHEGYKVLVRRADECVSVNGRNCILAVREQVHAGATGMEARTRFHSYSVEALVHHIETGDEGIVRFGGWYDAGALVVADINGESHRVILPHLGEYEGDGLRWSKAQLRQHHHPESRRASTATWYTHMMMSPTGPGTLGNATIAYVFEQFGGIWPNDPYTDHLLCPDFQCRRNGSQRSLHSLKFEIKSRWFDPDGDGYANGTWYVDQYGNLRADCTNVGPTCIPMVLENVRVGVYHWKDTHAKVKPKAEYDTSPAQRGIGTEWWIRFPN